MGQKFSGFEVTGTRVVEVPLQRLIPRPHGVSVMDDLVSSAQPYRAVCIGENENEPHAGFVPPNMLSPFFLHKENATMWAGVFSALTGRQYPHEHMVFLSVEHEIRRPDGSKNWHNFHLTTQQNLHVGPPFVSVFADPNFLKGFNPIYGKREDEPLCAEAQSAIKYLMHAAFGATIRVLGKPLLISFDMAPDRTHQGIKLLSECGVHVDKYERKPGLPNPFESENRVFLFVSDNWRRNLVERILASPEETYTMEALMIAYQDTKKAWEGYEQYKFLEIPRLPAKDRMAAFKQNFFGGRSIDRGGGSGGGTLTEPLQSTAGSAPLINADQLLKLEKAYLLLTINEGRIPVGYPVSGKEIDERQHALATALMEILDRLAEAEKKGELFSFIGNKEARNDLSHHVWDQMIDVYFRGRKLPDAPNNIEGEVNALIEVALKTTLKSQFEKRLRAVEKQSSFCAISDCLKDDEKIRLHHYRLEALVSAYLVLAETEGKTDIRTSNDQILPLGHMIGMRLAHEEGLRNLAQNNRKLREAGPIASLVDGDAASIINLAKDLYRKHQAPTLLHPREVKSLTNNAPEHGRVQN